LGARASDFGVLPVPSVFRSYAWWWLAVALQVAIPASYYLRTEALDDERFAWRMFSDVRLKRCRVRAFEEARAGGARAEIRLPQVLHSSWVHGLERGRRRIIERFLETRCSASVRAAQLVRTCSGVSRELGSERYVYECDARAFRVPERS
jgi:hypothetical protein